MHVAGGAGAGAAAFRLDAGNAVLDRRLHHGRAELALDRAGGAFMIDIGDFRHAIGGTMQDSAAALASYSGWRARTPDDDRPRSTNNASVADSRDRSHRRPRRWRRRSACEGHAELWPTRAARSRWRGRRLPAQHAIAGLGHPARQPIRLDGVVHPGGGPAVGHARFNGLLRDFAAVAVEERKLSAGLRQPALEITPLRLARPHPARNRGSQILARHAHLDAPSGAVLALRCSSHGPPAVNDD